MDRRRQAQGTGELELVEGKKVDERHGAWRRLPRLLKHLGSLDFCGLSLGFSKNP